MKDMPKEGSSEEKLLKIIGGFSEADSGSKKQSQGLHLKNLIPSGFDIKKIKMKNVNLGLLVLVFILTVVFIFIFVNKKRAFNQRINFLIVKNKKPSAIFLEDKVKKPSFNKYMFEIKKNNPFNLLPQPVGSKKKKIKVSFRLTGIIWSNHPQAIIEETVTKKTYIVYTGDSLVGGYKVEKISSNGVTIKGKNGEETIR